MRNLGLTNGTLDENKPNCFQSSFLACALPSKNLSAGLKSTNSLLVIAFALMAPMEPTTAASALIIFLPAIRVGSMITLWVLLARSHGFGPVRIIFLGLPSIFFVSICSSFLAFILALYFYAYLVARSF
jgi:hypothetical protein